MRIAMGPGKSQSAAKPEVGRGNVLLGFYVVAVVYLPVQNQSLPTGLLT